jgi:peptide-methionine (S)-S-oxide reductase
MSNNNEIAVFAGGCFWCTEAVFQNLRGVTSVLPGYSGGQVADPTYEQVSSGTTGHAEATKIEFDPGVIKYGDLLNVFFATHDPTTINRQGNDVGEQYRSIIFYMNEAQKKEAENFIARLKNDKVFESPIVTTIEPFEKFYLAEDYHKNYFLNHSSQPYCQIVINPKLQKLKEKFAELLK